MSEVTSWGKKIWQACPSHCAPGIGERTLIERLQGLGDYAGYQRGIKELVEAGYLLEDKTTHTYRRSTKEML